MMVSWHTQCIDRTFDKPEDQGWARFTLRWNTQIPEGMRTECTGGVLRDVKITESL